jgi:hypothetical protein
MVGPVRTLPGTTVKQVDRTPEITYGERTDRAPVDRFSGAGMRSRVHSLSALHYLIHSEIGLF